MNLKSLALSAIIAATSLFGAVAPASAATCWFDDGTGRNILEANYCSMNSRINDNGHIVWDIVDHLGNRAVLVLWTDGVAELFMNGQRYIAETSYDSDGDLRLVMNNGFEMAIRFD